MSSLDKYREVKMDTLVQFQDQTEDMYIVAFSVVYVISNVRNINISELGGINRAIRIPVYNSTLNKNGIHL